jgi:hypothetical protein
MEKAVLHKEALVEELHRLHTSCNPSCIMQRCNKEGCTFNLPTQQAISIDCDLCKSFPNAEGEQKPDFIVLYIEKEPSYWFVLEMKSRVSHAESIVKQLQAGADVIQNSPYFKLKNSPQRLVPVLLRGRGIHANDIQILNSRRISFAGRKLPIRTKRCGTNLTDLL